MREFIRFLIDDYWQMPSVNKAMCWVMLVCAAALPLLLIAGLTGLI